jgi:beta-galactosidase
MQTNRSLFHLPAAYIAALVVLVSPLLLSPARAQTNFSRIFAPQQGRLAPVERPARDEICLNGSWQFAPVALPIGFQTGKGIVPTLPPPTADGWDRTPIRIPSPWNVNTFPDRRNLGGDFRCFPSYPAAWNDAPMGWLRRTFSVPAGWKGRRLILHFDAVAGDTQVLVNGKPVGRHFDNFLPFDLDVTDAVHSGGGNELLVGVRKASLFDVPGKYGRRPYQGGSMWGQHIAGIWQDVFLEAVPTVHISDVFVKPSVDRDLLEAEVTVVNEGDAPATVRPSAEAFPWINDAGKDILSAPEPKWRLAKAAALRLSAPPEAVTVPPHGTTTITLRAPSVGGRLKFWSPDSPNLYGLVCRLGGGKDADIKFTRFGWRQITFQGATVLLNGKPLVMNGDSWHFMGIPQMTRRYAWAWYRAMKDAHLNAVRLHAQPYPSFYLDVADELGILVLDENAVWASDGGPKVDDDAFWQDTKLHLEGLIRRDRNHPSVFGWSVSNELMAVVRGVFRAPKEYQDKVIEYDGIWADICRRLDPTRVWISADGEDDGGGKMPVYIVHYGGSGAQERASKSGKPWGVGEAGPAYYGSPKEIDQQAGAGRAYLSFEDRMNGVAAVSYQSLADQRRFAASYRSVFNMVWYGLKPLELGMRDTTRPPTLADGVFFPRFIEGQPGVQPERLGPYSTTLNPGYDARLPLYKSWPLFDAIRDASAEPPVAWKPKTPLTFDAGTARSPAEGAIHAVRLLASPDSPLRKTLADLGVPFAAETAGPEVPLLFVDGAQPPVADAKPILQRTLDAGGTVFVWGTDRATLDRLNALLPAPPVTLADRTAVSLVPIAANPLTAGISPAALYFAELSPSTILTAGLGGPLVESGTVLLAANSTDWTRWNRQAETIKTGSVVRSEREAKPSGAALVTRTVGKGRLILCNLPLTTQTSQAAALYRTLLANLGISLGDGVAQRNLIDARTGAITGALAAGRYPAATRDEALATGNVPPNSGPAIAAGTIVKDRVWTPVAASNGSDALDLRSLRPGGRPVSFTYLSVYVYSPKALDNLLLDPHLPVVDLTVASADAVQVWLNGKSLAVQAVLEGSNTAKASGVPLQQGWNHLLVKVVQVNSAGEAPTLRFVSNQADFLGQVRGLQEKP